MKCFRYLIAVFAIFSILSCGDSNSGSKKTDSDEFADTDNTEETEKKDDSKKVENDDEAKPSDKEEKPDDSSKNDDDHSGNSDLDNDGGSNPLSDSDQNNSEQDSDETQDEESDADSSNPCINQKCGGNGECSVDSSGSAVCSCNDDFINDKTDAMNCIADPCKDMTCGNNGTCSVSSSNNAVCTCNDGFMKDTNNHLNCVADPCDNIDCGGHGTCEVITNTKGWCTCNNGYLTDSNNTLNCIEGYDFPNGDFENWDKTTSGVAKPTDWRIGSSTKSYKITDANADNYLRLNYPFNASYTEDMLTSAAIDCGNSIPARITFRMKAEGKIAVKLNIANRDLFYKLSPETNLFSYLGETEDDSNYIKTVDSSQSWATFTVKLGSELDGLWTEGNSMEITLASGKSQEFIGEIDSFNIEMEKPECYDNSECTDTEKPMCDLDKASSTFMTCIPEQTCSGVSIKDIRKGTGIKTGDEVTVCVAHVTSDYIKNFSGKNIGVYIADPDGAEYSGIKIYEPTGLEGFGRGDFIKITGTYEENLNNSQLSGVKIVKLPLEKVDPKATPALSTEVTDEKYEGMLVKVENLAVTAVSRYTPDKEGKITVTDNLTISTYFHIFERPQIGTAYKSITGILNNYQSGSFEIRPRDAADMVPESGNNDPCTDIDCSGHGKCSVVSNTATCQCADGYVNSTDNPLNCVLAGTNPCENVTCGDHGTCSVTNSDPVCECDNGFVIDENDPLNCMEKAPEPIKSLIISEVVQHRESVTSIGTYIEIFNPTGKTVDLTGYTIETDGTVDNLDDSSILPYSTLAPDKAVAISKRPFQDGTLDYFKNVFGYASEGHGDIIPHLVNNRAVILKNSKGDIVDIFGETGTDGTGKAWDYQGKAARRKYGVVLGKSVWDPAEWEIIAYSDVTKETNPGKHFIEDPCISYSCGNDWSTCNPLSGNCDIVKDGMCATSADCSGETPKCNPETHVCEAYSGLEEENVITNGSFENWTYGKPGDYPDSWGGSNTSLNPTSSFATMAVPFTVSPMDGEKAIQINNSSRTPKTLTTAEIDSLEAGTYKFTCYVKGNGNIKTGLFYKENSSSDQYISKNGEYTKLNTAEWTEKSYTFTLEKDVTNVQFSIWAYDTNFVGTAIVDYHLIIDMVSCVKQ